MKKTDGVVTRLFSGTPGGLWGTRAPDAVTATAILLLAAWCMNAVAGFVFILLAARLYPIGTVGLAMLLVAWANLVVLVTRFGVEQSMIRYYDAADRSALYCASVLATTLPAIGAGILLIGASEAGLLGQEVPGQYAVVFLFAVLLLSVTEVSGFLFLAGGRPALYLVQTSLIALRVAFVFFLVPFGTLGLFSALVLALALSALFSVFMAWRLGIRPVLAGRKFLADSFHFSLGNYIGDFLQTAPVYLLPIMVFTLSGERGTAVYSVAYAVASVTFLIPAAVGSATFIAGCRDDTAIRQLPGKRIVLPVFLLLGLIILVFFLWGNRILAILGPAYAGSSDLVLAIMGASLFALFFQRYVAEFKIRKEIRNLILLNGVFFCALVGLSWWFMRISGPIGAGYAWIAAYAAGVLPLAFWREIASRREPA